jgi:hypothetical protein
MRRYTYLDADRFHYCSPMSAGFSTKCQKRDDRKSELLRPGKLALVKPNSDIATVTSLPERRWN